MFGPSTFRLTLAPLGALAISLAILLPLPASAADEDAITVELDYARIIKLDRAVSRVIVGNSNIADATVSDSQTIILTGKSFGTTNLVILDADGTAIVDERVLVSLEGNNTMQVYRQADRTTLSCTPACEELNLP
ncbi:MAG: pilus assembly protein N-terminal domain-containing protein [Pseudomonadota bacterium]